MFGTKTKWLKINTTVSTQDSKKTFVDTVFVFNLIRLWCRKVVQTWKRTPKVKKPKSLLEKKKGGLFHRIQGIKGLLSRLERNLSDLSETFLSAAKPGPLPVSSTALSHIPSQTFTHPRRGLSMTGSSCEPEEFLYVRLLLPSLRMLRCTGLEGVHVGPKGGRVQSDSIVEGKAAGALPAISLLGTHEKRSSGKCWLGHAEHTAIMLKQEIWLGLKSVCIHY